MRSLSIAATGMLAQQANVEVISNNIANMNTSGFKRRRAEFHDLLYQDLRRVGSPSSDAGTTVPAGVQIGLGVRTAAVYRISEQGDISITDNSFDLAINGDGYFLVTLPSGETAYTRAGAMQLSSDGELVTPDGYPISPGITVPTDTIGVSINPDGQVFADIDGQVAPSNLGQIELAIFANEGGLRSIGDNLLVETEASGPANVSTPGQAGYGRLLQGAVETSNVNVVSELTNMITAQRAYEMNSRVIQASDEMMQSVSNLR